MESYPAGDPGRASLNRRRLLRIWVKIGLLVCLAAFAVVFTYGLLAPGTSSSSGRIDVRGLAPGTARLEAWNGGMLWIVRRSARQLEAIDELSGHVRDPGLEDPPRLDRRYRSLAGDYGVYLAATGRSGIFVQYLRERPAGLGSDVPWHGGFVDPGSDALFDFTGRRYRSTDGGPLTVPPHRYSADGILSLGGW
jgi:hypothetical protein